MCVVAQVDGFMAASTNGTANASRVSGTETERERWCRRRMCIVVWGGEVHVGYEWWSGVVHESDDGKGMMIDELRGGRRNLILVGWNCDCAMSDWRRQCIFNWASLLSKKMKLLFFVLNVRVNLFKSIHFRFRFSKSISSCEIQ